MPGSARENDQFVKDWVIENKVKRVLDMGVGKGTYSEILTGLVDSIDGVEVWRPYIDDYNLVKKYDNLFQADIREFVPPGEYDLVIFGDVLEHMNKDESLGVWEDSKEYAKAGLISVPIIHYPQGAEFGNPYEVHVQDHLTPEHIREVYGPFDDEAVYEITGTFIRKF